MRSFSDSAVTPSIWWIRSLSLPAALLLFLMLASAPWYPAAAEVDNPNDRPVYCDASNGGGCATPDGVAFSVIPSKGREGTDATLDFTVTVDNPRSESMTVPWRTEEGGDARILATEGEDFTASSGSLSIPPGRSSHTVSIPIIDDSIVERWAEPLYLVLDVGPRGSDLDYNERYLRYFYYEGRIHSDDTPPLATDALVFCDRGCTLYDGVAVSVTSTGGREGTDETVDFAVTVDNPRSESMIVAWTTEHWFSGATAGEDYTASSGTLTLPPGRSRHTVSIPIIDDSTVEVAESIPLVLDMGPRGADLAPGDSYARHFFFRGWVLSDDDATAPTVTVTHAPLTTTDGTEPARRVVSVEIEFSEPVTGFDKSDLEFENGRVVQISADHASYGLFWTAHILPDDGFAGTMSIRVPAGAATDQAGLTNTASNTIEVFAAGGPHSGEVDQTDPYLHRVELSCEGPSDPAEWANRRSVHYSQNRVGVYYTFQRIPGRSGYAITGPSINMAGSMVLTNEDGMQAEGELSVSVGAEHLGRCHNARGCSWSTDIRRGMTGQLTLQMLPDAAPGYMASAPMAVAGRDWSVSATDASGTQGTDATVDFEIRLNARDDCKAVKVDYATADGTATAGEDYTAASGTLSFEPGENVKTVRIPVLDERGSDSGETFTLRLSNAQGVFIRTAEVTGTILNKPAASLSARFENLSGPNDGSTPLSFQLQFSETPRGLSYKTVRDALFDVVGGTVTAARRLTKGSSLGWAVTVQPDRAGEVAITVRGTESCEDDHAVCAANGAMLAGGERLVVTSSQPLVVRATADPVPEGPDTKIEFSVRLSHGMADEVRVRYGAASDSRPDDDATMATAGEDYKAVSGSVAFAPGETQKTVSVSVLDDELVEGDETVRITFSDADRQLSTASRNAGRFANFSADATIMDDDRGPEPLTASFANMPESHGGNTAFEFELHFSENVRGLSYKTVRDALFDVVNGTVTKTRRLTKGSNLAFVVTVKPTGQDDIEISVRGTESCDAAHAVCAADGRMLAAGPSVTVPYAEPITLSVADAEVDEGLGATLDFVMSLSRAADHDITVHYRTDDGTATAGADYEAVRSSIVFSPGQTERTVSVVVVFRSSRIEGRRIFSH